MRSIVWAFTEEPLRRFPLQGKGGVKNGTGSSMTTNAEVSQKTSIRQALWDALDLCINLRGIGWSWSPIRNFRLVTSQSRTKFLFKTAVRIAFHAIAIDVTKGISHAIAPETTGQGTILDTNLPFPQRLFYAAVVACMLMLTLHSTMQFIHDVSAFCFISGLGQDPAQWPPLFDRPWLSTSLREFWGKRWHQLFRGCFVSLGSRPFVVLSEKLSPPKVSAGSNRAKGGTQEGRPSRNPLFILGAFFISGVFHYTGCRAFGKSHPVQIIGFFMMQGLGVILEEALMKRPTSHEPGLKPKHKLGRVWVVLWLLVWGIFFTDACVQAGLLGISIFPESVKPLRVAQVVCCTITMRFARFVYPPPWVDLHILEKLLLPCTCDTR